MTMQGLDEIQHRFAGPGAQARAGASLEITLGKIERHLERAADADLNNGRAAQPILIPSAQFLTVAGVLQQAGPEQQQLGPEDGQVWHVQRVGIAGLQTNTGTLQNSASVTAPAAGATITSVTLTPGQWAVSWSVMLAGTPAAGDANNFRLVIGSSVLTSINPGSVGGPWGQAPVEVTVPVNTNAIIKAVGAGTAGAIYTAQLSATPAGAGDTVSLYREIPGAGNGQSNNFLWQFTPAAPVWEPKGLYLRSPEQLLLAGSGLITAGVVLSADGIAVEPRWLSRYVL